MKKVIITGYTYSDRGNPEGDITVHEYQDDLGKFVREIEGFSKEEFDRDVANGEIVYDEEEGVCLVDMIEFVKIYKVVYISC